jgi:hypothetical protein
MLEPNLGSGVIKRNGLVGDWINSMRLRILVIVATLARQREIFNIRSALRHLWNNVFHGERLRCKHFLAQTVFAATVGSLCNSAAQRLANAHDLESPSCCNNFSMVTPRSAASCCNSVTRAASRVSMSSVNCNNSVCSSGVSKC